VSPAPKKPPIFDKLAGAQDSGAGYDLVGNIVVGLGLVWVLRHFWPEIPKAWYGAGVVLGAISGFFQLFKSQSKKSKQPKPRDDAQPPR
jgi:F0F1-type ATP synthase assembly protein I